MSKCPAPALAPIAPRERLANLDALRAVALFGVLMVNLLTEFRVSIFEQFLGGASGSPIDCTLDHIVALGLESKAFILFSFLFGVGLAIQFERAKASGRAFGVRGARRLGSLLVIGLVHLVLIWNGDILSEYALAGFCVLPLLCCRRALLPIAVALLAVFFAPLPYPQPFANRELMRQHIESANAIYAHGSFGAVEAFRVRELRAILALLFGVLPRTLALFVLGIWAWRAGVFLPGAARARLLRWTALVGLAGGGGATLVSSGMFGEVSLGAWRWPLDGSAAIALALGYGAAILAAHEYPLGRRLLGVLAPLGRMALTNYLSQSLILGFVFYGYGGAQFGTLSVTRAALLGCALYALQAIVSAWWLQRFAFGPVEWLWRSATYAVWQPLRVGRASGVERGV